jgi:hypothetical protein
MSALAMRWLVCCAAITAVAGSIAVLSIDDAARWSLAVPAGPAILLAVATIRGREKSWYGEVAAAAAFAGLAVPVAMAAGAPLRAAASIAVPFAVLFVGGTLAVRTVILGVRAGGNLRATTLTQRSAVAVTAGGAVGLAGLGAIDLLPPATLGAAMPGILTVLVITARPPHPTHLRTIGWRLVAVSLLTAVILVATV